MDEYDIVVIGGGSGSQVASAAADEGLEAAVIERGPLGGACVTRGCVPSKALIHRADVVEEVRRAPAFGVDAELGDVDFDGITSSVHDAVYEKADRQREQLLDSERVALYEGEGRFVDDRTLEVDGASETVRGERVVVAVGSRPSVPPIDGIEDVDVLTSDDALFLDERPDELVIVGGGYIAAELGYFFGALGTDVTIVGRGDVLVPREDSDVSEAVTRSMEAYCDVRTGYEAAAVDRENGRIVVTAESDDEAIDVTGDRLLLATGRRPNTDALDLDRTGVETDDRGYVETDEHLATTAKGIWALGDVVGEHPFKHVADYETRIVSENALGEGDATVDYEGMPHAIFTSPQVASVGRTEDELADEDVEYESTIVGYDAAPMGMILDEDRSFVKVLAEPDGGEILGCHVVGSQASTMIHEVVVAVRRGSGTVDDVAGTVHVHPALNEVVLKAFDELSTKPYSTAPDWRETADGS